MRIIATAVVRGLEQQGYEGTMSQRNAARSSAHARRAFGELVLPVQAVAQMRPHPA